MNDEVLSVEEYERLFAMNDVDYERSAPSWIRQVPPIEAPTNVPDLLQELQSTTKTNRRIEQLLTSSWVPIPEDIPYEEAKEKIAMISERLNDVVDSKEYQKLCMELEKYTAALMASDEYHEELKKAEQQWEQENEVDNKEALKKIWRHMPVKVRFLSETALVEECKLPKAIARKFQRTNVLQLLRKNPEDVSKMHPSMLEGLKTAGLTLTERRALYEHLKPIRPKWEKAKDAMTERKLLWYNVLKSKFKEMLGAWKRHVQEFGPPSATHKCKFIGNQCPFKADNVDYSGDYGFPACAQYEETQVAAATKIVEPPKTPTLPKRPDMASFLSEIAAKKPPISPAVTAASKGNRNLLSQISEHKTKKPATLPDMPAPPSPRKKTLFKEIKKTAVDKKETKKAFEKKAAERPGILDKHYDGRKQDIKGATRSCDMLMASMDLMESLMDEWIDQMIANDPDVDVNEQVDSFREGVKDLEPISVDILERAKWIARSSAECELAEDLFRLAGIFFNFIKSRMKTLGKKDRILKKTMKEVNDSLTLVHHKNLKTLGKLGIEAEGTRKIRTVTQIIEKKMKKKGKKSKKSSKPKVNGVEESEPPEETNGEAPAEADTAKENKPQENSKPVEFALEGKENLKWQLVRQLVDAARHQRKLEKAMTNAGLTLPDEKISYQEAEKQIAVISKRMTELDFKHPEYFTLEQEMQKYSNALMASDEYRRELQRREKQWDKDVEQDNKIALKKLRRHMPVNIRVMSEAELISLATPNGKKLPERMVKKFKRSNVLQLIRMNPTDVEKMHFANLEGMSLANLTLTELRAVYEHIRTLGSKWERSKSDKQIERKYMWFVLVRNKFKQTLEKWEQDVKEAGPPGKHRCKLSPRLCPVQTDADMSYDGDYGFTDKDEYETLEVTKEKSQAEAIQLLEERAQY